MRFAFAVDSATRGRRSHDEKGARETPGVPGNYAADKRRSSSVIPHIMECIKFIIAHSRRLYAILGPLRNCICIYSSRAMNLTSVEKTTSQCENILTPSFDWGISYLPLPNDGSKKIKKKRKNVWEV